MAALELLGAALPPVCVPSRAQNSKPCPKQDSAVEHAIDGSIPYMEERDQRSTLLAQETTYSRPIAAATPRAAAEGPVGGAMSEDSSQHGAAGEASLSHHLDRTPARGDKATSAAPATSPARRQAAVYSAVSPAAAAVDAAAPAAAAPAVNTPVSQSPAPSGGSAPLPRRRCVLVAKQLTNSDASSGRIILPRVAVESNLSFVLGYRHYALAVKDCHGRRYEFMIKSWANGTEHRRVFVLEQAGEFLRSHGVGVGDAVGICTDEHGELVVEANSEEVRQATVSPKYGALALQAPPPGATAAVPLLAGACGRCVRSPHCSKAAGHPGFCSGPKAAAAAAARQQQAAAIARQAMASCQPGTSEQSAHGGATAATDTSGEEAATRMIVTPRSRHAASSAAEYAAAAQRQLAAAARLPPGLHQIAAVPAGMRLCKPLTAYDLTSRRVVMPVPAVEAGIANAASTDLLTLAAVDESQRWHFPTLHAWTNVAGRRGYLLEGLADMLSNRGAREGDCLLVFRDTHHSPPRIELLAASSAATKRPAALESGAPTFASLPLLLHPKSLTAGEQEASAAAVAIGAHSRGLVLLTHRRGPGGMTVCRRTTTCTKAAGHQGFCSGHKGFKRRESPTASSALGARRPFGRYRNADWVDEDDEWLTASDDDSSPSYSAPSRAAKRARRASAGASRDASPGPLLPPSASDPLLSLLSVLDSMDSQAAAVASAAEEATQTAEAAADAAHAAYTAFGPHA